MLNNSLLGINNDLGADNLIFTAFDIGALLLSLFVIFNYAFSKKVRSHFSAMYCVMLAFSVAAAVFDILYLTTKWVFGLPSPVHDTFYLLFYTCYLFVGIVFFVFAVSVVYEDSKIPGFCYMIANILFVVGIAGIVVAAVYRYGDVDFIGTGSTEAYYMYESIICGAILGAIVAAMIVTIINRQKLRLRHRINVYMFLALNTVAVLVQMLVDHWHVSSFALAIAMLLLYITLQRPEEQLDAISGMFNAGAFIKHTNAMLAGGKPFIAFASEVNNIAIVNSSFGFRVGNQLIVEVALRLKELLPKDIYLYRLGGVRFAILFQNMHDYEEFEPKYLKVFDEPFDVNGNKIRIAATACKINMPEVTDYVLDVENIIKYYRSSAKSSDMIFTADKQVVEFSHRRERVEYAIQKALKNRSFQVYYQPIYSVKTKKINSCEALIRLNDSEMGFIPPDEFIPIAEQTGRIVEVGRFVMEEVCRFIKEEQPEKFGIEFIDVNLSVIQCMHPEIIEDIDKILKEYGVPRSMVNLEVTETASAQSYALLQSRLNDLHKNGFTISLDDFGTGFSSVEYLINFPFDVVKLDKSLVWAYMSTKKYEPILKHYMPMLHGLGTRIVAEGIETEEMVKALTALGCDYLQGYYFSKPIPEAQFLEYIKKGDVKLA